MKNLFYLLFVGSFLASGVTFADDETPLAEEMSEASGFLKLLRRSKGDYPKCLELVRNAQKALLGCFAYSPALLEEMPEGKEKAMAMAKYKKTLAASYQTLCDLEVAYLSEDIDKIDDATDAVKQSRKSGHQEFIK